MENWRFLEFVVLFVSTCCCSGGTFTESCKFEPLQANQETIRNFMRSKILCGRICEKLLTQIHRKNWLKCVCRMRRPRDIRAMT